MIHSDTVLVMNRDGSWMSIGFTVSYVTGKVGCSRDYEAIFGSKCQGYQANMELHHISSSRSHDGICFVENPINNIIQKIVDRTPPPNVDSRYPAFSMVESFSNLWKVKHYEDQVALEQVDNVMECDPPERKHLLLHFINGSDNNGSDNFSRFLERARPAFLESLGLDPDTPDAYKFKRRSRPDLIHETVVLQEYHDKDRGYNWRILHGRCPIIGLGGTKQSGHVNQHWPLVCHHMEYKKGEPWSLVTMCNSTINLGLEYLEGDFHDIDAAQALAELVSA